MSREVSRNTGLRGYRPRQAQERSQQRQRNKPKFIKLTSEVQGRLKSEGYPIVCGTTIYTFIQNDKHEGGELYKHLRHRKAYKKRTGALEARGQIIGRIPIDERPAIVDEKSRIGDWEADTIIGRGHKGVLVTLAERFSKKTLIAHIPSKHAEGVKNAIIEMLLPEKDQIHTITSDNDKEFAFHAQIKEALGSDNYFAHPS